MPPVPTGLRTTLRKKIHALGDGLDCEILGRWLHETARDLYRKHKGDQPSFAHWDMLRDDDWRKKAYLELARILLTEPHYLIKESVKCPR